MVEAFFQRLRRGPRSLLLTDYDGTLAPFVTDRNQAYPYPGVRRVLGRILRSGTTDVVVVSGRSAKEVATLLGIEPVPEIWGAHGWEHMTGGAILDHAAPVGAQEVVMDCAAWLRSAVGEGRVEVKASGLALHWRGANDQERARVEKAATILKEAVLEPRARGALELRAFDGGLELRYLGRSKGDVVDGALAQRPGGMPCAYLGDDNTDEDAFRALGDRGLSVLVRPTYRPTAAHIWLRPPDELIGFLERWSGSTY